MLSESGYRQRRSTKDLAVYDPDSDTEFFYLRPRDIAVYVAAGTARADAARAAVLRGAGSARNAARGTALRTSEPSSQTLIQMIGIRPPRVMAAIFFASSVARMMSAWLASADQAPVPPRQRDRALLQRGSWPVPPSNIATPYLAMMPRSEAFSVIRHPPHSRRRRAAAPTPCFCPRSFSCRLSQ